MTNVFPDASKIIELFERIESINEEILSKRGEHMATIKGLRARIKDVYDEAHDAGWSKQALRAAVTREHLRHKIIDERDNLTGTGMEEDLDKIEQALGFETTPLGMAAVK